MSCCRLAVLSVATVSFVLLATPPAPAIDIHLTLQYVGSYDAALTPIGTPLGDVPAHALPSDYHGFDVFVELTVTGPDEDLWFVQFDVRLAPGFSAADVGGWLPDTSHQYDPPGPPPAVPLFSTNADSGSDPNDLQGIVAVVTSAAAAAAMQPGEGAALRLGTAYVEWDGVTLNPEVSLGGDPEIMLGGVGWEIFGPHIPELPPPRTLGSFDVVGIPEPTSAILAALAAAGLLGLVRRPDQPRRAT